MAMCKATATAGRAQQSCNPTPLRNIGVTCKSPVGDISAVTLIRTDTTLDHSQKAEKVWMGGNMHHCWHQSYYQQFYPSGCCGWLGQVGGSSVGVGGSSVGVGGSGVGVGGSSVGVGGSSVDASVGVGGAPKVWVAQASWRYPSNCQISIKLSNGHWQQLRSLLPDEKFCYG